MSAPLVLKGNLSLGTFVDPEDPDIDDLTDVSDEILTFKIVGNADTVEIPATLGRAKRNLGGSASYSIELGYMSTPGTSGLTLGLLWAALETPLKEVDFAGTMRDEAVSAENPLWVGRFNLGGGTVETGGDAEALSQSSSTFACNDRPEQLTS